MCGWCTERVNAYLVYQPRRHAVSTTGAVIIQIIIYFIDAIDFLGNHIYIFIDYNPILRILGGKIHRRRT